jgi:hypothetical protein
MAIEAVAKMLHPNMRARIAEIESAITTTTRFGGLVFVAWNQAPIENGTNKASKWLACTGIEWPRAPGTTHPIAQATPPAIMMLANFIPVLLDMIKSMNRAK